MPVTAKRSKLFYEHLGEQIANELVDWFNSVDATCRSDLKEINELNWARMDAKLLEFRAEVKADLATLKADLLKWMFAFWATNMLVIAGLILQLR